MGHPGEDCPADPEVKPVPEASSGPSSPCTSLETWLPSGCHAGWWQRPADRPACVLSVLALLPEPSLGGPCRREAPRRRGTHVCWERGGYVPGMCRRAGWEVAEARTRHLSTSFPGWWGGEAGGPHPAGVAAPWCSATRRGRWRALELSAGSTGQGQVSGGLGAALSPWHPHPGAIFRSKAKAPPPSCSVTVTW